RITKKPEGLGSGLMVWIGCSHFRATITSSWPLFESLASTSSLVSSHSRLEVGPLLHWLPDSLQICDRKYSLPTWLNTSLPSVLRGASYLAIESALSPVSMFRIIIASEPTPLTLTS